MSVVQLEPPRDAWDDRTVSELMVLASSRSADDRQRLLLSEPSPKERREHLVQHDSRIVERPVALLR